MLVHLKQPLLHMTSSGREVVSSWWRRLPEWLRLVVSLGSFATVCYGLGVSSWGFVAERRDVFTRIAALELADDKFDERLSAHIADASEVNRNNTAALSYFLCRSVQDDAGQSGRACMALIQGTPWFTRIREIMENAP